ncbi:UPF0280 family protein [Pseudoruegeria sp. SK021]|uniref:UPF0280 family protein n=1 Tax=Pseudoruegeria sp. SK021 TaxID=1933035 RepID=UPI000A25EB15|nr:UPF0280 family protein [Pseudoruegeria sp. SK021]OSP55871.1 hypothetical protein BV911_05740 [Pseudoruegeria sp. SK021]
MSGPVGRFLPDGERLHLQHGPIDLVIGAEGPGRELALRAAELRFATALEELVAELPLLRSQSGPQPSGDIARRMAEVTAVHASDGFVTPMAAVAGAVAEAILAAMTQAGALDRAYVNNGGDIALHLGPEAAFRVGISGLDSGPMAQIPLRHDQPVRGIATSGLGGRSLSMGIADAVTVLARTAAEADVAATLIANAVDLPGHGAIRRAPAHTRDPDSDLGARMVVIACGPLSENDISAALSRGACRAQQMIDRDQIIGAALVLRRQTRLLSMPNAVASDHRKRIEHA